MSGGGIVQQDLVWVSPEDYDEGEDHADLPGSDLPALLIQNGIQVKRVDEPHPLGVFTYCPGPMMSSPIRVQWISLSSSSLSTPHVVYHRLSPNESVLELIKACPVDCTSGMILITTDDSFLLSRDHKWERMAPPPFPVCVMNAVEGRKLLELIGNHDSKDLLVHISNTSITMETAMRTESSPSEDDLSLTLDDTKTKGGNRVSRFLHRPKFDLKKKLKELLLISPNSTDLHIVSENKDLFQRVMEECYQYELVGKGDKPHNTSDNSRVFKKLIKFLEKSFSKDAPFYLLLSYRVLRFKHVYQCDQMVEFIHKCIDKFEEMMFVNNLEPLMGFIARGDIAIHLDDENPRTSSFKLLEKACIPLMKESVKMKTKTSNAHTGLLSKMIWLTVSLKFKSLGGSNDGSKLWNDFLTKDPSQHALDASSIEELVFGMRLGQDMKLPVEATFSTEQLGALMANGDSVRPFSHISDTLNRVYEYLHVPDEFLTHIIVKLRDPFKTCIDNKRFEHISIIGSLLGAIQEGLGFLDCIYNIWTEKKGWMDKSVDKEMTKWLQMLLGAVDITSEKSISYLKEFLTQMIHPVCSQYYRVIIEQILNEVHKNFRNLTILKFSRLFKSFYIWPADTIKDYLLSYGARIPHRMNINDVIWVEFLTEVVDRFQGAQNHTFIFEFLTYVADHYLTERRPKEFVFHLLSMNIPGLFAILPSQDDQNAQSVPVCFKTMLKDYIQRNRLSTPVISHITAIWKSISQMCELQLLVLTVLEKELIPESRSLQRPIQPSVKTIIDDTINLLSYDTSWMDEEMSLHHKFAFGVVSVCCSLIPISERLDWTESYDEVVEKLGSIYACYCQAKGLTGEECILHSIPDEVASIGCDSVTTYFQFVRDVQQLMLKWKKSFDAKSLNYDDIKQYNNFIGNLHVIGSSLCADSLILDPSVSEQSKTEYLKLFEKLNIHLIKYIPGQPAAGWLLLPSLLSEYGIEVPEKIGEPLSQQIIYPGETDTGLYMELMTNEIQASCTGSFMPGHDISLKLASNVSLYQLHKLVHDLDELLSPIQDNLDLLIYFFLHKSAIFDTYLRYQLRKFSGTQSHDSPSLSMQSAILRARTRSSMGTIRRSSEPFKGISWKTLADSLTATKELVVMLVEGTAQYSDVTAGGNLALEKMDLDVEFKVLVDYTRYVKSDESDYQGLHGIQCMLELFQYAHHIVNVYSVCEQYHLKKCLEDERLIEIKDIAIELQEVKSRDQLTSKDAIEKVQKIVSALCLKKRGLGYDQQSLRLFPAIADSSVFYQFIKDKGFTGEAGQEVFRQQYDLITAQLQHEEYNEMVLNHLLIAFQFISPFLDDANDFEKLMKQVNAMNLSSGFQELYTVNKNIHLVRLWFSRAEEDSLETVPGELDAILRTGEYQFVFDSTPDGCKAELFLEYQPPSLSFHHPVTTPSKPTQTDTSQDLSDSLMGYKDPFDDPSRVSSLLAHRESAASSPPPNLRVQRWNSEQIRDFEQRIGFLDPENELTKNINKFLMFNQNSYKLLELYQRLNDLGHPLYTELEPQRNLNKEDQPKEIPTAFKNLSCALNEDDVSKRVEEAEEELNQWTCEVAELHKQYETLLFFSIPKLRHVHKKLVEGHIDNIVAEISFLFKNNIIVREKLKSTVKVVLNKIKVHIESCSAPMKVVGSFLHELFVEHEMARFALQPRHPYKQLQRSLSSQTPTVLHSCHGLSRAQLVSLIINCYNGVPESFQLFHCQTSTSEDELMLFLNRSCQYAFQYMVIGVEKLPYQLQELLLQFQLKTRPAIVANVDGASLHFVETGPSVLREMPWIMVKDHKDGLALNYDRAKKLCRQGLMAFEDFQCITLVYGHAGDGKTHLIKTRLRNRLPHMVLHIPINEAFVPLSAIKKLQTLPIDTRGCCIYFNFTILPPPDSCDPGSNEWIEYHKLMESVNMFFFDFLILGYVEDPTTGESFRFPGGLSWSLFIEVPSLSVAGEPADSLQKFLEEVPTLGLIGTKEYVEPKRRYVLDDDVQLVCKYLRAFDVGGKTGIDKLYKDNRKNKTAPLVKFSEEPDMDHAQCLTLLDKYTPPHLKCNKTTRKLFVSYMKRRCEFLDNLPAYNYNTGGTEMVVNARGRKVSNNTLTLGSTLMKSFLKEVEEFCDPAGLADWSKKPHHQLIYDTVDGGSSIGLISLHSEGVDEEMKSSYEQIGIQLPTMMEMHSREWLDDYLSRALNVPLDSNGHLRIIDDSAYVLTLDYTLKMLNIHERHECGMPVVIEGETGVGKTALVEILSKLWNYSHVHEWHRIRDNLLDFMQKKMNDLLEMSPHHKDACLEVISNLSAGSKMIQEDLQMICELPDSRSPSAQFHSILLKEMIKLKDDPVLALLELTDSDNKKSFNYLFRYAEYHNNAKATAELLNAIFNANIKNTFHKLNVHAALKPLDVIAFFKEVSNQAYDIEDAYNKCKEGHTRRIPSVTVFLDEINTTSCLGLFKEIIVDKTIDGTLIPHNVFIIGACNPHRGDSLAAMAKDESWIRSNYYVRVLHPTLDMLKWDYGSLDENQELYYINAKLRLLHSDMYNVGIATLSELIVTSQKSMREFAYEQLCSLGVDEASARTCARSSVSQRDIQRVFTFYEWLMKLYTKLQPHGTNENYHHNAIIVSLSLTYFMRLNDTYRLKYNEVMNKSSHLSGGLPFSTIFTRELDWFIDHMDIPHGIAKTQALKENIFGIILCTMTHTPLIIVGPPGCSKTLSFNLVTANLRGQESKMALFRDTELFHSLDSHYYQCSHRTTSNEIQTVFSRSVNRQRAYAQVPLPIYCVVFMDEAGLPEESLESLKVLHYHLDRKEVSFVAISNHLLDAAKTNRAVSLYRSEPSIDELRTLAKGCLCDNVDDPPVEMKKDLDLIVKFCPVYHEFMKNPEFKRFYGLRDFIHFINFLQRQRSKRGITEKVVMHSLERNFNGSKLFDSIAKEFMNVMGSSAYNNVNHHSILDILHDSVKDQPQLKSEDHEVRYKLIIDTSEDNSLLRLLFAFGVLKEKDTRTYVCSDFPGDSHQQLINTIAAVRHSAAAGHTVIMSQTDEIHESFYDLFNQRFRRIDDPKSGPRMYANIAIGAHHKPCRIHPSFQCIVVVKHSEVADLPHPFLNRFEKYCLTHKTLLDAVLRKQPAYLKSVLQRAYDKAKEFISHIDGASSLYGYHDDTLDSLVLSLLPPVGFQEFLETDKPSKPEAIPEGMTPDVFLLKRLLRALRKRAGFRIPHFTRDEIAADAEVVMQLVSRDSQFAGQLSALTHEEVLVAIPEALRGLYHANKGRTDLSINACMVISVFLQWFVRHLCKRLMQLMTTESLTSCYRSLPHSYTESYLKHQSHFNLKALIDKQLQVLLLDDRTDRSTTGTANRLLLFTRSSALIHQLPSRYPSTSQPSCDYDDLVRNLICGFTEDVSICKLSSITSQAGMMDVLNSFWMSKKQQVLLLIANMKETSHEMISHLRVMIEENDTGEKLKLFVLLVHFPPSMFSSSCYPSLFSNTWDHHYLDIIGQNPTGQVMDICQWLSLCCSYITSPHNPDRRVPMNLSALLSEAIPTISSRVFFGKTEGVPFNCPMDVSTRNKSLQKLFDKGVGEILCEKFLKYWEPGVMLEYLEKAAILTTTVQTSTLSITDSVQCVLRDTFFDYMVYMVSKMNEDMNIDIIMDPDCSQATLKLFLDILTVYPLPKLSQLKTLSSFEHSISSLESSQRNPFVPKFPFYRTISGRVEKIIEQTRKDINQRLDTLHEYPDPGFSLSQMSMSALPKVIEDKSHLVISMQQAVEWTIKQMMESSTETPLKVALKTMLDTPHLMKEYSDAFTHQKLRLSTSTAGISFRILRLIFTQLHPNQELLTRLVLLHVCMHVYQLDLSRLVQVLRPLDTLLEMAASVPEDPFADRQPSPTASFLNAVQQSGDLLGQPGDLSKYVLRLLFSALSGSILQQSLDNSTTHENVLLWFDVYRDVMSMSAVKDYLYKNLTPLSEAQHNIMQTVFLIIQSGHGYDNMDSLLTAIKIFTILFEKYLTDNMELKNDAPPRLKDAMTIVIDELIGSSVEVALQHFNTQLRRILEGLFSHYFSKHLPLPHHEDIKWFFTIVNKNYQWTKPAQSDVNSIHESDAHGCVPMSVFKYYATTILDGADISNVGTSSMTTLTLYKPAVRDVIGQVLVSCVPNGVPAPYIPTFYQSCTGITTPTDARNELMQQPLAHMYFTTVLHHLNTNGFSIINLVRVAGAIAENLEEDTSQHQKVLHHIEKQAVIQATIHELAKCLNPSNPNGISSVASIVSDINYLLDDVSLGGGDCGGHSLVLALHLLKEMRSFTKFNDLLGPNSHCKDFTSIQRLSSSSIDIPNEDSMFPFFIITGKGNLLKELYDKVGRAMLTAHTSSGRKLNPLISLSNEWSQGKVTVTLPDGQELQADKSSIFKMMIWFNTYYKFYCQKKPSPILAGVMMDQLLYIVQPFNINKVICAFLDPAHHMIHETSVINNDSSNYDDPIFAFFNPETKDISSDDISLRHAIANMIAVVVATPPTTTHLWYLMFNGDQLVNTHLPGFMLDKVVGVDDVHYNDGVVLNKDGFYEHQTYIKHATRGTLSLQSLYLLLWSNVSSLCVGLLTDVDSETKLIGHLFPEYFTIRSYCMKQLKSLWNHLSVTVGISCEERSFLVSRSMWNLLQVSNVSGVMSGGRFPNMTSANSYESMWYTSVFMPIWNTLKDEYSNYSSIAKHQLFNNIKCLDMRYPCFTNEQSLIQSLLSNVNIGDPIASTEHLLGQLVLLRPQLEIGGAVLTDLVEFYQWLHQELGHVVTKSDAETIPISRAVRVLAKSYSPEEGDRLQNLYKSLKESYNQYQELMGSSDRLEDSTPLINVLSISTNDSNPTSDLLYNIISDIITTHNNFLMKAEGVVNSDSESPLACYLSKELPRVHPTEFTDQNCIIEKSHSLHGMTPFALLINSRSSLPSPLYEVIGSHTCLPSWSPSLINLQQLQEDVFSTHVTGKPLIGPPQTLRINFSFRDGHHVKENLSAIEADLETISSKLLDDFKCSMDPDTVKVLEQQFHNSSYHLIMETVSGLRGVAGHLIRNLMGMSQGDLDDLIDLKVVDFLSMVFDTQEPLKTISGGKKSIFHEIGLHSLTINQFTSLEDLMLVHVYDALKWFVMWISQGWHEFCSLPFATKIKLSPPDVEALLSIPGRYTGSDGQLLNQLKAVVVVLSHFESTSTITSMVLKEPQMSLVDLLTRLGECRDQDDLMQLVPDTVLVENYVHFRVIFKELIVGLQKKLSSESLSVNPLKKSWEDFIDDLWSNNLSHFRNGNYSYAVVSTADQKRRVYTLNNIDRNDEDLLNDLMNAGVSESNLLPDTDVEESSNSRSPSLVSRLSHGTVAIRVVPSDVEDVENSFATVLNSPKRERRTRKLAEGYTCEKVCEFLVQIGLKGYVPQFEEYGITGEILLNAGQGKGLEELGVVDPIHRLKIYILFRRQLEGISKIAKRFPVEEVIRFLHSIKMSEHVEKFEENQIDGEMLMEITEETLEALGVTKHIQRISIVTNYKNYIRPRFTTL